MSLRTHREKAPTVIDTHITSFLFVMCGETHVALPAGIIRGIVRPDDQGISEALTLLDVRTPVADLAARFGLPSSFSADPRIVVCGMGEARRAFMVGAIVGLEDIESSKIRPLLPHFTGPERHWFSGMFLFRETVALAVEPHWLLSEDQTRLNVSPVEECGRQRHGGTASSPSGAYSLPSGPGQLDILELEEATDADDIPWAQL
ncbi:MAG: chemotaxis protein CheW [Nitrospiraceae bacterium]